jgi:rubrerythrin
MGETQVGMSKQVLELLRAAMQVEQDGYSFYSTAATETKDSMAVKMFLSLARDEMEHLGKLERVYCTLSKDKQWPVVRLPSRARHRVFPGPGQAAAKVKPDTRELAALQRGIQAEEDSIAFYRQAMAQTTDPEALAMYQYFIAEEQGHLAILKAEYDYLTQTGFWFNYQEFNVESRD